VSTEQLYQNIFKTHTDSASDVIFKFISFTCLCISKSTSLLHNVLILPHKK